MPSGKRGQKWGRYRQQEACPDGHDDVFLTNLRALVSVRLFFPLRFLCSLPRYLQQPQARFCTRQTGQRPQETGRSRV